MTSSAYLRDIRREFAYEGLPDDWQALLDRSLSPRGGELLFEVAEALGYGDGQILLEAGCRDGRHASLLAERYGCTVVGVDIVEEGLRRASRSARVQLACADLEALPAAEHSVDHVWCRDVLEMVEDPGRVLTEFGRVLKPGGSVLLYVAYVTDELEARERARLLSALRLGPAGRDVDATRNAIRQAGLEVESEERISPEWTEAMIEQDVTQLSWGLLTSARLLRDPAQYRSLLGDEWYERMLAWARWSLYLLLGKIETRLWVLRAPAA